KSLAAEYQTLLRSEWVEHTTERVIQLLRSHLEHSGWVMVFPWERPAKRPTTRPAPLPIPPTASEHLREYLEMTNQRLVAPLPDEMPSPAVDPGETSARVAEQADRLLILQSQADLEGDAGLFRDLQSILFSCCLHFLLPSLDGAGLRSEHDVLLNVLWAHAANTWRDQPAHAFFLQ